MNINFISEQNGEAELEFKSSLLPVFLKCRSGIRAYLMRVQYNNVLQFNVAMCLMLENKNDEHILREIAQVFKRMFGKDECLDIILLDMNQEINIRKIATPFYVSEGCQINKPDFF